MSRTFRENAVGEGPVGKKVVGEDVLGAKVGEGTLGAGALEAGPLGADGAGRCRLCPLAGNDGDGLKDMEKRGGVGVDGGENVKERLGEDDLEFGLAVVLDGVLDGMLDGVLEGGANVELDGCCTRFWKTCAKLDVGERWKKAPRCGSSSSKGSSRAEEGSGGGAAKGARVVETAGAGSFSNRSPPSRALAAGCDSPLSSPLEVRTANRSKGTPLVWTTQRVRPPTLKNIAVVLAANGITKSRFYERGHSYVFSSQGPASPLTSPVVIRSAPDFRRGAGFEAESLSKGSMLNTKAAFAKCKKISNPEHFLSALEVSAKKGHGEITTGYKTRLELDNMAPGDSFHFRVQRGRGQWSTTLAATTKDDQAPMVALHRAISQGLPHRARKFLSQRPLAVDVPDRAGRTALLLAVLRGDVELVYLLLNAGADPNHAAEGAANRTPLMLAAHRGAATLCRALRDRGARWDVPDRNGCTALHYAVAGDGVAGLRSAAAAPASSGGTEEVVRMALEDGADVHVPDSYGWTPLMRAGFLGNTIQHHFGTR
ncbi:hypothetical protein FOCC_FOCC007862 [Frankliniella occidentalis]|nr:hypothetical protein FOCC_FOCC007862 [Frankliniella occidentalis]